MKAIIGGTGVYDIDGICDDIKEREVVTEYGVVSVQVATMKSGEEIVFLPRHGKNHNTPPHKVNYHANIMALKLLGVTHAYATCAVGSLDENIAPGDIAVINDFIDQTKTRNYTFFDGKDGVKHVDMSDPYCANLRELFMEYAAEHRMRFFYDAIYVCTEGPRFETAAEIKMYQSMGAHLVGMTNVPEVILAKEMGIHYAAVGIVTNYCTGVCEAEINGHEIMEAMAKNKSVLTLAFAHILANRVGVEDEYSHEEAFEAVGFGSKGCTCETAVIEM